MISIKSENEIKLMREAGRIVAVTLEKVKESIRPGITTKELDQIAENEIRKNKMIPAFKGYHGFPASTCISINEEVVHGIPSTRILQEGDIVSVDVGTIYNGYYGDAARTFAVGEISDEKKKLIQITKESFFQGMKYCTNQNRLSDISNAIQKHVEKEGYSVVKDFVGHGIGCEMHEDPQIPNYGIAGRGPRLQAGMVLAIEPMINIGTDEVEVLMDNWTAVTADGKASAHYENTVVITEGEPIILTSL